jgi:chloramphenicol-sensitive protein RarD
MKKGILYGIGAYAAWGFFPIYWKFLHHVPAIQLIGHRIIWSCLLLIVFILFTRQWDDFRKTVNAKVIRTYTCRHSDRHQLACLCLGGQCQSHC